MCVNRIESLNGISVNQCDKPGTTFQQPKEAQETNSTRITSSSTLVSVPTDRWTEEQQQNVKIFAMIINIIQF